jgi:hypothetical protein
VDAVTSDLMMGAIITTTTTTTTINYHSIKMPMTDKADKATTVEVVVVAVRVMGVEKGLGFAVPATTANAPPKNKRAAKTTHSEAEEEEEEEEEDIL